MPTLYFYNLAFGGSFYHFYNFASYHMHADQTNTLKPQNFYYLNKAILHSQYVKILIIEKTAY